MAETTMREATGETTGRSVVVLTAGWESAVRGWWMIATGLTEATRSMSSETALLMTTE